MMEETKQNTESERRHSYFSKYSDSPDRPLCIYSEELRFSTSVCFKVLRSSTAHVLKVA